MTEQQVEETTELCPHCRIAPFERIGANIFLCFQCSYSLVLEPVTVIEAHHKLADVSLRLDRIEAERLLSRVAPILYYATLTIAVAIELGWLRSIFVLGGVLMAYAANAMTNTRRNVERDNLIQIRDALIEYRQKKEEEFNHENRTR